MNVMFRDYQRNINPNMYHTFLLKRLFRFSVLFFIFDAIKLLRIHKYRKRQEDARHIVMTILIIIAVVVVIFIAIYNSLVRKRNETGKLSGDYFLTYYHFSEK